MDRKEDREILRKGGFAEGEMKRLSQLRRDYNERERLQSIAEHRRLEFDIQARIVGIVAEHEPNVREASAVVECVTVAHRGLLSRSFPRVTQCPNSRRPRHAGRR